MSLKQHGPAQYDIGVVIIIVVVVVVVVEAYYAKRSKMQNIMLILIGPRLHNAVENISYIAKVRFNYNATFRHKTFEIQRT